MSALAPGRLLAIGDVHGQANHLESLVDAVAPAAGDRLILLGDYVDGGPDAARTLDLVARLQAEHGAVALRGNHDDALAGVLERPDVFPDWAAGMGRRTAASYGGDASDLRDRIADRHGALLDSLADWHEEPEAIFVHAAVDPTRPMPQQSRPTLLWTKVHVPPPMHESGRVVVCGHTAQRDGLPRDLGTTVLLDTDAKRGGWLTCLDVTSRWCWQSDGRTVRELPLGGTPSRAEPASRIRERPPYPAS